MKNRILLLLLITLSANLSAQTDTLFWFAVPYATIDHDPPLTADLTLTATDENNITTVTISQPYNPQFTAFTVTIDPTVSMTQNVTFSQTDILKFSNNLYNTKSNSALLIRSDREITAYYEIHRTRNNPAIFALKGKNALGYDFWTPFQNQWSNNDWDTPDDPAFSQIIIVATEDNTEVNVTFQKAAYGYAVGTHTIFLDKGQTFMFVPKANPADNNDPSILAADRLIGTHITSNKPIAVTLGDDSVVKGGAYDYLGDQHIPTKNAQNKSVIGYEYVIMKGQMSNEKAYVMVTEANTSITVTRRDGSTITYGPYAAGYQLGLDILSTNNDFYVHISATHPVYVLHIAGFGDEMGEAILPTIDGCTGSLSVSFTRSKDQAFYLNLMTKADAIDDFSISINGAAAVPFLNASMFEQAGNSDWYVLTDANKLINNTIIPTGAVTRIFNTKNVFHLGYFNGVTSGGGCVYGYFSDYNELEASATVEDQGSVFQSCGVDSVQLKAKGGISYHWSPTEYLDNPDVQNPILRPPYGGFSQVFTVDIEQPCHGFTQLQVWVIVPQSPNAFMAVDYDKGCAPLAIDMKDASDKAKNYILDLGDGSPLIFTNSPINLTHTYANTSNSPVDYILSYTVRSSAGCNDFYTDTIRVFPQVTSDFELTTPKDTTVCHGTTIEMRDLSTGNTDSFLWDFGDGSSDTATLVNHTYKNFSINDTVFDVSLIATSPYGCLDTSDIKIRVYPYIHASFVVDSTVICSPARLIINPAVSVGVDTFYWAISDINKTFLDSSFKKLTEASYLYQHSNTIHSTPDSLQIAMNAVNRFGCRDTATTRQVIVYPEVNADFDIDDDIICDSVGVLFTNNSTGYNLLYEWDFDNGTSIIEATGSPFTRYFLNRSTKDTIYNISLVATSDYFCKDTAIVPLTVYPFVNANFSIDYSSNCSPLNAAFNNISIGADVYNWTFGDGFVVNTISPDPLYHIYENTTDHDTTFYIRLIAQNTQGCIDSIKRTVSLFSQVVAGFSYTSPNEGCNPLNVSFLNNSKGKDLNYIWDFGDKTYSASQNPPPKVYMNATAKDTTYFVNLTVTNLAGCDSSIVRTVTVYSKVTADFAIERVDSCSPFKIKVSNYSSGGITDFIWKYSATGSFTLNDFSDPIIPPYINQTLGPLEFPFSLTTQNIHGCSAVKKDTITVFPEIRALFTPDITEGCQPLPVSFVNGTNIKSGTAFYWNFDDGRFSNLESPAKQVFNNLTNLSRIQNVRLEATSQYGCYDDTIVKIEVYPYIYSKFTIDRPSICSDELFSIDRTSAVGAINHYYWDYEDDGTVDEDKSISVFDHTYSNTGSSDLTRKIRLTVTNPQGCDTTWTESILIHPEVRAKFNIDDNQICYPQASAFTNLSEPAVPLSYNWNFGDGSSSTDTNPAHAFKNFTRTDDETFTISLTAVSDYGCDSTISHDLILHPKPLADFSFPMAVDCPPFDVIFTNNSKGKDLQYFWDFDNGTTSTETNPGQTFNNDGTVIDERDISLIITTAFGCGDTLVKPVSIYPNVEVDFDASDWNGCNPVEIILDGTATNETEYYWYVDGTIISNYEDPLYRFVNETSTDKIFNVRFKAVSVNGCTSDTVKQITIYPKPIAEFLPDPQVQDFNTSTDITSVTLKNLTNNQSVWVYRWDYGDGTNSEQQDATFVKDYTIWGDISNSNRIPVSLIATNNNHTACSDTILHYVIINPPIPQVELGPDISGCMPLTIEFPSTTKYNYPDKYQWDFGYEGKESTNSVPVPLVYDTAGVYIIRLAVQGDGGSNWDYKRVTVYPKPIVNFSFTPDYAWLRSQNEDGTPIKFFNTTIEGLNYLWDFGDGESTSEFQPQHEYMSVGTYYVTLVAESGLGCYDTLMHETPIVIDGRGKLEFPNVITIVPGAPAEEYYNPGVPDPNIFRPVAEGIEEYKLEIYNRWGELLFVSEEVDKGWNGYIKDSPAKQDVYVWRVTARFTNGRPYVKAGDVTVLVREP